MKCDDNKYRFYAELETYSVSWCIWAENRNMKEKPFINIRVLTCQDIIETWLQLLFKQISTAVPPLLDKSFLILALLTSWTV